MRAKLLILMTALIAPTLLYCADEVDPRIKELQAKLEPVIKKHYPDATLKADGGTLSASANLMTFSIHNVDKIGKIAVEARPQSGPTDTGFVLSVQALREPYGGAAMRPQSQRGPYWTTYLGLWKKGEHGVTYNFSYGANVSPEFMTALYTIFEAYRKE